MPTIELGAIADQLKACGITHVVWVPDSEIGGLEKHLDPSIRLVRACREGEATAIAAGLMLGGARPAVVIQCTGFFEAGDAFRNVVKDLKLPLFLLIGHRNRTAFLGGTSKDSAAKHLEPLLSAWELTYAVLEPDGDPAVIGELYARSHTEGSAAAVVIAE
jgi:sulfopyruvate decarboxylase TPP-binding subunit